MPKRYVPQDIGAIFDEIGGGNDRAAIAVGGSTVEYALEQCIRARLRWPQTKSEEDALFTDAGIIGTFFQKIWLAYFLKIIGPETRQNIDRIRAIRNHAAHDMNAVSFETPEIASRCRLLDLQESMIPMSEGLRERFVACCKVYSANLLMRSADQGAEIIEAFENLAPFLDR